MEINNISTPWKDLPLINNNVVNAIIKMINTKQCTPRMVFNFLKKTKQYLNCEQLRTIHTECAELYSDYSTWYLYDHALCSRVTDLWNLTPKMRAEGYYYCSLDYANKLSEPPYKWEAMELERPFF